MQTNSTKKLIPKYKKGDCIISGEVIIAILAVISYKKEYYYSCHLIAKDEQQKYSFRCEHLDKQMLTTKVDSRIIKLLYE